MEQHPTKKPAHKLRSRLLAIVALLAMPLFIMQVFLGSSEWKLQARTEGEKILFEPHIQSHPGHLTFPQAFDMATKIDIYNTVLGDMAKKAKPIITAYANASMIGLEAPDFDLRTTDGEALRLFRSTRQSQYIYVCCDDLPPCSHPGSSVEQACREI